MIEFIGVDWADGCWVVVEYGNEPVIQTEPSILNVWHRYKEDATAILVDIPIGLAQEGKRECDTKGQQLLRNRSSTVFTVPVEKAVMERDYEKARNANIEGGFNGLGSQSWGLVPRIREVNIFLEEHNDADSVVPESHPEVCFAKLPSGQEQELPPKSEDVGREQRLSILEQDGSTFGREVKAWVEDRRENAEWYHRIQSGRLDDVIDATVLALTAKLAHERDYPTLPEGRRVDETPLIVHPGG